MPVNTANELLNHYAWIARWSEEIATDVDLDMKKLAQLAFAHCRVFEGLWTLHVPGIIAPAVAARFAQDGIEWPNQGQLISDMNALASAASAFYAWAVANVGASIDYATLSFDDAGNRTETPIIDSPKPAAVNTEVAALRALFS